VDVFVKLLSGIAAVVSVGGVVLIPFVPKSYFFAVGSFVIVFSWAVVPPFAV